MIARTLLARYVTCTVPVLLDTMCLLWTSYILCGLRIPQRYG